MSSPKEALSRIVNPRTLKIATASGSALVLGVACAPIDGPSRPDVAPTLTPFPTVLVEPTATTIPTRVIPTVEPTPSPKPTPDLPKLDYTYGASDVSFELLNEVRTPAYERYFTTKPLQSYQGRTSEARWHVLRETVFLNQQSGSEFKAVDESHAVVEGQTFDLIDPTQRNFADALLQIGIEGTRGRDPMYLFHPVQKSRERVHLLMDSKMIQFVDGDGPPYVEAEQLVQLQPALDVLSKQGKALPSKWTVALTDPSYDKTRDLLAFNNGEAVDQLGLYYMNVDPSLYSSFMNATNEAIDNATQPISDPKLLALDPEYSYRDISTPEKQFMRAFSEFVNDGMSFRTRIKYAQAIGDKTAAVVLQAQYDALKDWLGAETDFEGELHQPIDPKAGDILNVAEHYDVGSGVIVKQEPKADLDPSKWVYAVYNGMRVKVVDPRPVTAIYTYEHKALDYIRIQATTQDANGKDIIDPRIGWIASEYLTPTT